MAVENVKILVLLIILLVLTGSYSRSALSFENGNLDYSLGISVAQIYDGKRKDHKGSILILDVYENSPADKAGLLKGDIITHINGRATKGRDLQQSIMNLMKGHSDTSIELKILKINPEKLFNVYIVRR